MPSVLISLRSHEQERHTLEQAMAQIKEEQRTRLYFRGDASRPAEATRFNANLEPDAIDGIRRLRWVIDGVTDALRYHTWEAIGRLSPESEPFLERGSHASFFWSCLGIDLPKLTEKDPTETTPESDVWLGARFPVDRDQPPGRGDKEFLICWKGKNESRFPQILYGVWQTVKHVPWVRGSEIVHWYYQNVIERYELRLDPVFQRRVREYVHVLWELRKDPEAFLDKVLAGTPEADRSKSDDFVSITFGSFLVLCEKLATKVEEGEKAEKEKMERQRQRLALLEVTHTLGMIRWRVDKGKLWLDIIRAPQAHVLLAKIFGLKTSIEGFDDILGGGLIVNATGITGPLDDTPENEVVRSRAVLGVIRGHFASGKSTLAAQLAFEMARKGGAGILLVLEQSLEDVINQYHHFGWWPEEHTVNLIPKLEGGRISPGDHLEAFSLALRNQAAEGRGILLVHALEDSSLDRFQFWLQDIVEREGFRVEDVGKGAALPGHHQPRFIIVDPLDAVQLAATDGSPQAVRASTEQILRRLTSRGFTTWLTSSELVDDPSHAAFSFIPNIGDVVIRMSSWAPGDRRTQEHLNAPPHRLIELEKVRTQRFAKGVHTFHIRSEYGIRVFPSGEAMSQFDTWSDNSPPAGTVPDAQFTLVMSKDPEESQTVELVLGGEPVSVYLRQDPKGLPAEKYVLVPVSDQAPKPEPSRFPSTEMAEQALRSLLAPTKPEGPRIGHPALHQVLGNQNLLPGSITTFMGPTGCAKTELAMHYLLYELIYGKPNPKERSLFIAFRDTWKSVQEILKGPVGTQLGVNSKRDAEAYMDLEHLDVGSHPSSWVLQRIREIFKQGRARGSRYTRVVIDNVAYMELTSPSIQADNLFVHNLVKLLRREGATTVFITSLVERVAQESKIQAQIRDASDNLIILKQNAAWVHSFIALQVKKSQQLLHESQPIEILVGDSGSDSAKPADVIKVFRKFVLLSDLWWKREPGVNLKQPVVFAIKPHAPLSTIVPKVDAFRDGELKEMKEGFLDQMANQLGIDRKKTRRYDLSREAGKHSRQERLESFEGLVFGAGPLPDVLSPGNREVLAHHLHVIQRLNYETAQILPLPPPRYGQAWLIRGLQAQLKQNFREVEHLWRMYWLLADHLEIEDGISFRSHSLDVYNQAMSEAPLDWLSGITTTQRSGATS